MAEAHTFSVSELCQSIEAALHAAFPAEVWVRGEVHDLKRPPSGHVYFDLVAPGELGRPMAAKLSVALFAKQKAVVNRVLVRAGGGVRMTDGVELRVRGALDFHAPSGQLKLVKVNVDESPRLQQRFAVQAIPTLMVLRDGKVLARQAGAAPVTALRSWLDQSLAAAAPAG